MAESSGYDVGGRVGRLMTARREAEDITVRLARSRAALSKQAWNGDLATRALAASAEEAARRLQVIRDEVSWAVVELAHGGARVVRDLEAALADAQAEISRAMEAAG